MDEFERSIIESCLDACYWESDFSSEEIQKVFSVTKSIDKTILSIRLANKFNLPILEVAQQLILTQQKLA